MVNVYAVAVAVWRVEFWNSMLTVQFSVKYTLFEMVELGEFSGCLIAQQGWNFVRSVDQSDRPRRLQSCNLFSYSSLSPRVSRALTLVSGHLLVCQARVFVSRSDIDGS